MKSYQDKQIRKPKKGNYFDSIRKLFLKKKQTKKTNNTQCNIIQSMLKLL